MCALNHMLSRAGMIRQITEIVSQSKHLTLELTKLHEMAQFMEPSISSEWWQDYRDAPEHYQLVPVQQADEDALMFYLVNTAQMWLIWEQRPDGGVQPWHLYIDDELYVGASAITAAHLRALAQNQNLLDTEYLVRMKLGDVETLYCDDKIGRATLQCLPDRLAKFNEIGHMLRTEFGNRVTQLLERAGGFLYTDDGQGLIQLLVNYLPKSFGDWPFCKLANVLILSLWNLRESGLPSTLEFMRLTTFHDLENLEGGADYYRPLFLMRVGLIKPAKALRVQLIERTLIARNSEIEQEIRAATIRALRALAERIGEFPASLPGVEVETHATAFLKCRHCRVGISDEDLFCPYKPVCAAYNEDHELMKLGWPLVLTISY